MSNNTNKHSEKTRVLLCQPWDYRLENQRRLRIAEIPRLMLPNYGMVLLATMAKKAGYAVELLDAEPELIMQGKGDPAYILKKRIPDLVARFHPDIVGISCISDRWPEAYRMAKAFQLEREKGANFKLIFGGVHPTSQFESVFAEAPFTDWIHLGESEKSFLRVLNGEDYKTIAGVAWKENGAVRHSAPESIELDALPFPDWRLVDTAYYFNRRSVSYAAKGYIFPFLCSRGCVYQCSFCNYKFQRYNRYSLPYVSDYIAHLIAHYKADMLYSCDSFLCGDYLLRLCEIFIEKGFNKKVTWGCSLRANTTKREDLVSLKKANCYMTYYGFESGSDRILHMMNKRATREDGLRVARYNHEVGIMFQALIMFGYPQEELLDVRLTQRFLIEAKPHSYAISVFAPMPGSSVFDELVKAGKINIHSPEDYRVYSYYETLKYTNFTAMDDKTYQLVYTQLMRTVEAVANMAAREWVLKKISRELHPVTPREDAEYPQEDAARESYPLSLQKNIGRLKAAIIRRRFGEDKLKEINDLRLRSDFVSPDSLIEVATFLCTIQKIELDCNTSPVAKLLPRGVLYLLFLYLLKVYEYVSNR